MAGLGMAVLAAGVLAATAPSWSAALWPPTSAVLIEYMAVHRPAQEKVVRLTSPTALAGLWAGTVAAQAQEHWHGGPLFPTYVVGATYCWPSHTCRSVQYDAPAAGLARRVIVQWPHAGWTPAPPGVARWLQNILG